MDTNNSKRWWLIGGLIVVILIVVGIILLFFLQKTNNVNPSTGGVFTSAPNNKDGGENEFGDILNPTITQNNRTTLFTQLTNTPISGFTLRNIGNEYVIRYAEKESGHIYEISKGGTESPTMISNTTLPGAHETLWANNGNVVIYRYLEKDIISSTEVIKTYIAETPNEVGGQLKGKYLIDNISILSIAPNSKELFYLVPNSDGVAGYILDITSIDKINPALVFTHPMREWIPTLLSTGNIFLTTKASYNIPGYAYEYSPKTKVFMKLINSKNSLTTLPQDSGKVSLWSSTGKDGVEFGVEGKTLVGDEGFEYSENIIPLTTLPEKCVWSKDRIHTYCGAFADVPSGGVFPDGWYQGVYTLADSVWYINTETSEIKLLGDPEQDIGAPLDIINPTISPNEEMFYLINKKNGALWQMTIVPQAENTQTSEELRDAIGSEN